MITEKSLYTETMARVYADQGHLGEAARIYRHLSSCWPGRTEYKNAYQQIESRLSADRFAIDGKLIHLISMWIELEIGYSRTKRFVRIRTDCNSLSQKMENDEHIDIE